MLSLKKVSMNTEELNDNKLSNIKKEGPPFHFNSATAGVSFSQREEADTLKIDLNEKMQKN